MSEMSDTHEVFEPKREKRPRAVKQTRLVIWVAEQWIEHPAVRELAALGHVIVPVAPHLPRRDEPDLILHPAAHMWHDAMWDYLDDAVAAAMRRKDRR